MNIAAELRNSLGGAATVIDDPAVLPAYSRDQSQLAMNGEPACVLIAKSTDEVSKAVAFANKHRISVIARGAGSGLSGGANAISGSIIISLEKMQSIISIDTKNLIARVEPGVINANLDQEVAKLGLAYLPDPASREWSTIGGNVATNAGGMCCVKYGVTANHIRALTVVIGDGSIIQLGHAVKKAVTHLDLLHLFVGSEGTLGIVTEITVSLTPRPKPPVTLIATFADIATAAGCIPDLVALRPSMLEIMDQATLAAVESWKPMGFAEVGAVLILQSDDDPSICERAAEIATKNGALDASFSDDPRDSADLIQVRKLAYPALERRGVALLDDVCVPISAIGALVTKVTEIAKSESLLIGIFGHGGDGNMHPTIVYDHGDTAAEVRARRAFLAIIEAAQGLGGTASGEHGIGSIKVGAAKSESDPKLLELQRLIKAIFDPAGIFNPGKKLP